MGDVVGVGLIVYNARTSRLCRVESDFMKPTQPDFEIANHHYRLGDIIYGVTIIGTGKYFISNKKKRLSIM